MPSRAFCATILSIAVIPISKTGCAFYIEQIWNRTFTHLLCLILGVILAPVVKQISKVIGRRQDVDDRNGADSAIYNLAHGRLNITLPPRTMWMNMGYWENTSDFPTACRALLSEVLRAAKLLIPDEPEALKSAPDRLPLKLIDLGFGCGDQTMYLLYEVFKVLPSPSYPLKPDDGCVDEHLHQQTPLKITSYVGITLDRTQYRFARDRLMSQGLLKHGNHSDSGKSTSSGDEPHVAIFCADAAAPYTWNDEVMSAIQMKSSRVSSSSHPNTPTDSALGYGTTTSMEDSATWVLALDTMYHFYPSREPILQHSYHSLQASLMAFDLLLSSHTTLAQRLLLRIVCRLSGTPFSNFITESSYRDLLVKIGYANENITIKDISEHVFSPLARFLEERDGHLAGIGLTIGGFRVAGWMFRWWGDSQVVRGVVVVARR